MAASLRRTAEITVALPRAQAMALFTAEGERRWVDGWDPRFPDRERREGAGAVFVTEHGGAATTWVVADHEDVRVRYARVTPGVAAGTVEVAAVGGGPQSTRVSVTYDLTALSDAGADWLAGFERDYEAEIGAWERHIAAALAAG